MHDPSYQLQQDLQESVAAAIATRRPILTHLNADTSWLLQLPVPAGPGSPAGRRWYNILVDPWFQGPQNDVASWFSSQWHAVQSCVQTVAELNSLLLELEILDYTSTWQHGGDGWRDKDSPVDGANGSHTPTNLIDAVVISHEFTDHCHKETLLEVDSRVPVVATEKAAKLIRSWNHFSTVLDMPYFDFGTDWRTTSTGPLPPWLGVSRAVARSDALYYHSAVIIAFSSNIAGAMLQDDGPDSANAVVYAPHGIYAEDLYTIPAATPPVKTTALLHGLHDITLAKVQLNLGARNALKAQKILDAKYWIGTHDEVKVAKGLVAPFLRRTVLTLQEVLDRAQKESQLGGKALNLDAFLDAAFVDLASGQSLLLDK